MSIPIKNKPIKKKYTKEEILAMMANMLPIIHNT